MCQGRPYLRANRNLLTHAGHIALVDEALALNLAEIIIWRNTSAQADCPTQFCSIATALGGGHL
jgi:hypothetical protein